MGKLVRQDHFLAQQIFAVQVRVHHHHIKNEEKIKQRFKAVHGVKYIYKQ